MSALQRIYDRAPVVLQDLMVSTRGAINSHARYGAAYWDHRTWLKDYDSWSLDRMLSHQAAELVDFLASAVSHSAYYSRRYEQEDWRAVSDPADLPLLPVLEKEELRRNMAEVYTIPARQAVEGHTGGTTGKSLVVRFTVEDNMKRMAMLDHFKARHGFENRQMRRATFSGKHIVSGKHAGGNFWRYNKPVKQMLYSTFHLSEANLPHYVASLNDFQPDSLDGFVTSLCDVASYVERHGCVMTFKPRAIFPTSETVTPRARALLERVFGAPVYDQYASSEGAPFITECSHGRLHVEPSSGVFETPFASDDLLVTSFTTHGTPLVRYRIGDQMRLAEAKSACGCGYAGPLVEHIGGRSDDFLLRVDGAKINGGHVANLFKNMPNSLVQAQVVQPAIDTIHVKLVTDPQKYKKEYDSLLRDEFGRTFGDRTRLVIEHVAEIPREASGKQRFIKNAVVRDR